MHRGNERRVWGAGASMGLLFTLVLLVLVPEDTRSGLETDVALFVPTPAPTPATPTPTPTPTPATTPPSTREPPTSQRPPCYSDPSHAKIETLLDLEGEWLDTPEYHVPYTFDQQDCKQHSKVFVKEHSVVPSTMAFAPFACSVDRFSPHKFLAMLHNQTFYFLGDSLSQYHYNSLVCLLAKPDSVSVAPPDDRPLPGAKRFVCVDFTDTAVAPPHKVRVCIHRVDQEIGVGVWVLYNEGLLKSNDVVLANTGRHKMDHANAELHEVMHQMPEDLRGDENTKSMDSRLQRLNKTHRFVTKEFQRKGEQPPLFLWRTTFAAKYSSLSGDYAVNQTAEERECSSDPKWDGFAKQRRLRSKLARQSGLEVLDPFMASTLIDKTGYFGDGDCSHFSQPSMYIFTTELLMMYLKQRWRRGG